MDRHIPQYSASSNTTWSYNNRLGHGDCNTVTSRSAALFDVKLSNHSAPAFDTVFVRFRFPRRNAANQEIHLMMAGRTRQDSLVLGTTLGSRDAPSSSTAPLHPVQPRALRHRLSHSIKRLRTKSATSYALKVVLSVMLPVVVAVDKASRTSLPVQFPSHGAQISTE